MPLSTISISARPVCYHCLGEKRLDTRYRWLQGGHIIVQYSNASACDGCELKVQCARGNFRRITRWEGEAVLDRMAIRLAARPDILDIRRETVEHPFGSIKQWMNQGAFLDCAGSTRSGSNSV